ncbi:MAG TPA: DUF4097 family beta strand repeat-containing protein [Bryobacteraceae bacterium]|jgi:hypothetical protein|nr:DUF4097 family beta strand repeat-containing protein [Bryobacteraceae bacterium]
MNYKIAVVVLGMACSLFAQTKTEHLDFPAAGVLRFEHSVGDLQIEAWDQPGVEITTTKSAMEKDKTADLARVQISTKRQGDELVVTTQYPSHVAFPWVTTLDHATNFQLAWQVKVPRNAKLVIHHTDGEVHIAGVAGNIDASARQGLITLWLAGESAPSIDARSSVGSVTSDFPGAEKPKEFHLGHEFLQSAAAASQSLKLRIRFGDIIIAKAFQQK